MSQVENHHSLNSSFKKGPSDRSFGVTIALVLFLGVAWKYIHLHKISWSALIFAVLLLSLALLRPKLLSPFNFLWMRLAWALHKIVSPVFLFLFFYLMITPMAFVIRFLRRKLLKTDFEKNIKTYWQERSPHGPMPASFKLPF